MITGKVTTDREAIIELEIVASDEQTEQVSAVIDTDFNGDLTLSSNRINSLNLQLAGNRRATLGDGNEVVLDVYLATVSWYEQEREVLVLQADGGPLVGMSMKDNSKETKHVKRSKIQSNATKLAVLR